MENEVKAVLVGCGSVSRTWLDAIKGMREVKIIGLIDIVEKNALTLAAEYDLGQAVISTDFSDLLARAQPDVVFNCTATEAHLRVTMRALEAGCHVLGEKPLADSMSSAKVLVDAAKQAGRIFAVVQNY
jgi:predicted dehydrogenase